MQGLADVFILLKLPFDCDAARALNREVFETIYFAALSASCDLAKADGHYESYPGSPVSKGILQYDMWGVTPTARWDWAALKAKIAEHGVRNSLLLAPMPTASTAQILGNNECFEPYTSNLYARRTLAGEFFVLNAHLQRELQSLGLWNRELRDKIISAGGSVQGVDELPAETRAVFATAWEIKQRALIDMAADRGAFICQSQSLNLFVESPDYAKLSSMHFYAWKKGLKTGMYYLRTKAAAAAIQFTVGQGAAAAKADGAEAEPAAEAAAADDGAPPKRPWEACESCSG